MSGFETFIDQAVRFIGWANQKAAAMDGRAAFVLGLLTWFAVEQAIRRLAGALRLAIIVAALGASGVGLAALVASFGDDGPAPAAPAVVR